MDFDIRSELKIEIVSKLKSIFQEKNFNQLLGVKSKIDQTIVTEVDLYISDLIKNKYSQGLSFLSEEEAHTYTDHNIPNPILVLDPIDGTKELSMGIGECVLSVAIIRGGKKQDDNFAWIFNPFTGFEMISDTIFFMPVNIFNGPSSGLVSRSEWNSGKLKGYDASEITLTPRGSIAFKLSLLAAGACDFVITVKPKSIWDIAAGTILCWQRGFKMYEGTVEIKSLDKLRYQNPICWCRDEMHLAQIHSAMKF